MTSEQFIFLGNIPNGKCNIFFFYHKVVSTNYDQLFAGQIYNAMMNETMITDPNDVVVIYDILPSNNINLMVIKHKNKNIDVEFSKDHLINAYDRLLNAFINKTDIKTLIFKKYNNMLITCEVNYKLEDIIYSKELTFNNLETILTIKKF